MRPSDVLMGGDDSHRWIISIAVDFQTVYATYFAGFHLYRDDLAIMDDHEVHLCLTIVVSPRVEVVVLVECLVEFGQYEVLG